MLLQNLQDEFAELMNADAVHSGLVTPVSNVSIYRNNMVCNLVQTLMDSYKMIVKLVGEDFFRMTAKEYINRYPSLSGNLHDYGEYFADFLDEFIPAKNLVYLPEVARFEWACHLLYFAADASILDIKLLENISPDQFQELHFGLHPASRLMRFNYPILRIMDLCKGEMDEEINLNEGGVNLLLIRREFEIKLVPLSLAEYTFLSVLNQNETLGAALDATLEIDADFKLDENLPQWIQDKTITDFSK